jgi:nucleoside-diphosphate-sugar epimerase
VLVTGASGRIGSAVVDRLRARGERVIALDRRHRQRKRLPDSAKNNDPGVIEVVGDCTDEHAVDRAFRAAEPTGGIDRIVHLAALAHMTAGTPIEVFGTNVVSTFTVLAVGAQHRVRRAVIASSIHATGLLGHHLRPLPDRFPLDEEQTAHLDDWYSLSKAVDELSAGMVASRWEMSVIALRFPLVQSRPELEATCRRYGADPERALREGWTYLDSDEAARAVTCGLDADTSGSHALHVAAPDTLIETPTEELLDRYAPDVPRTRPFEGFAAPIDTSLASRTIGFTGRSRHDRADLDHHNPAEEQSR